MLLSLLMLIIPGTTWTWHAPPPVFVEAYVTAYSATETAQHNPEGLNAMGLRPQWLDVACPRNLKLGQRVEIMGYPFVCRDRYSVWLDTERDLPTFDIFSTDYQSALDFGIQKVRVRIVD